MLNVESRCVLLVIEPIARVALLMRRNHQLAQSPPSRVDCVIHEERRRLLAETRVIFNEVPTHFLFTFSLETERA